MCNTYLNNNINHTSKDSNIEYVDVFERTKVPAVLYKYRSFQDKRHLDLLYKRRLYLSSPNDFSDKNDCNLEERIPPKEELSKRYFRLQPLCLRNAPKKEKEEYANYMAENGLFAHPEELKRKVNQLNYDNNKQRGVLSLTKRWNNEYMWEMYGDHHQGFCVGFKTNALINTKIFSGGGDVLYYDELPQLDSDMPVEINMLSLLFAKKKDYENEEEYRLVKSWNSDVTNEERIETIPLNCFDCIIMGKDMNKDSKEIIKEIHKLNFSNITLYELIDE